MMRWKQGERGANEGGGSRGSRTNCMLCLALFVAWPSICCGCLLAMNRWCVGWEGCVEI